MIGVAMYLQPTKTYGSLIPGSEYIRSLGPPGDDLPGRGREAEVDGSLY
jgi:hypothetical protein